MSEEKVSIGLINPKSPDNVSSVMRAAGNFQVDSIFYTGKRYPRALMRNPDINIPLGTGAGHKSNIDVS